MATNTTKLGPADIERNGQRGHLPDPRSAVVLASGPLTCLHEEPGTSVRGYGLPILAIDLERSRSAQPGCPDDDPPAADWPDVMSSAAEISAASVAASPTFAACNTDFGLRHYRSTSIGFDRHRGLSHLETAPVAREALHEYHLNSALSTKLLLIENVYDLVDVLWSRSGFCAGLTAVLPHRSGKFKNFLGRQLLLPMCWMGTRRLDAENT